MSVHRLTGAAFLRPIGTYLRPEALLPLGGGLDRGGEQQPTAIDGEDQNADIRDRCDRLHRRPFRRARARRQAMTWSGLYRSRWSATSRRASSICAARCRFCARRHPASPRSFAAACAASTACVTSPRAFREPGADEDFFDRINVEGTANVARAAAARAVRTFRPLRHSRHLRPAGRRTHQREHADPAVEQLRAQQARGRGRGAQGCRIGRNAVRHPAADRRVWSARRALAEVVPLGRERSLSVVRSRARAAGT